MFAADVMHGIIGESNFWISTKKTETFFLTEFIPERFQFDGSLTVSASPENCYHFAEGPYLTAAFAGATENAGYQLVEPGSFGNPVHHKIIKGLFRVQRNILIVGDEFVDI